MPDKRQREDDLETRQGIPQQWEIDEIEAGKPPGDEPPPVSAAGQRQSRFVVRVELERCDR